MGESRIHNHYSLKYFLWSHGSCVLWTTLENTIIPIKRRSSYPTTYFVSLKGAGFYCYSKTNMATCLDVKTAEVKMLHSMAREICSFNSMFCFKTKTLCQKPNYLGLD